MFGGDRMWLLLGPFVTAVMLLVKPQVFNAIIDYFVVIYTIAAAITFLYFFKLHCQSSNEDIDIDRRKFTYSKKAHVDDSDPLSWRGRFFGNFATVRRENFKDVSYIVLIRRPI